MKTSFNYIDENLKRIYYNIEEAKVKYNRQKDNIDLMAVTKTIAPEAINYAVSKGISILGENRVQEYLLKKDFYNKSSKVHFIGQLQTNKIKYIINEVELIQSVDSLKLAVEIDKFAKKIDKIQEILIEVNIACESTKGGILANELELFLYEIVKLTNLKVVGLMTIPPVASSEEFLYKMQKLYIDISHKNIDNINMSVLSMGMSGDYVEAIKHGSNMIRIGSALFGARVY